MTINVRNSEDIDGDIAKKRVKYEVKKPCEVHHNDDGDGS